MTQRLVLSDDAPVAGGSPFFPVVTRDFPHIFMQKLERADKPRNDVRTL
jgi:hypothetical protein